MDKCLIPDVFITSLKTIDVSGGDIMHIMKSNDLGYSGFGESYFSFINSGIIKAWKRHHEMILNIVVPIGNIRFVLFDDRIDSPTFNKFQIVELSKVNYHRLTVPPMIWVGFKGEDDNTSMLLNVANIHHKPEEADRKEISDINFDWGS